MFAIQFANMTNGKESCVSYIVSILTRFTLYLDMQKLRQGSGQEMFCLQLAQLLKIKEQS